MASGRRDMGRRGSHSMVEMRGAGHLSTQAACLPGPAMRGAWWREAVRAVSALGSDLARRRLGRPVRGKHLRRWDHMVRASRDGSALARGKSRVVELAAQFAQHVPRRQLTRRPVHRRFVFPSSEEVDAEEFYSTPTVGVHGNCASVSAPPRLSFRASTLVSEHCSAGDNIGGCRGYV